MKKLKNIYSLFVLAVLLSLNACSSDSTPTPSTGDLATQVSGTYQLVTITSNGQVIPVSAITLIGGTVTIVATKKDATSVDFNMKIKTPLIPSVSPAQNIDETATLTLTNGTTTGTINIQEAGVNVGTYSAGVLKISAKDASGASYSMEAKK